MVNEPGVEKLTGSPLPTALEATTLILSNPILSEFRAKHYEIALLVAGVALNSS